MSNKFFRSLSLILVLSLLLAFSALMAPAALAEGTEEEVIEEEVIEEVVEEEIEEIIEEEPEEVVVPATGDFSSNVTFAVIVSVLAAGAAAAFVAKKQN